MEREWRAWCGRGHLHVHESGGGCGGEAEHGAVERGSDRGGPRDRVRELRRSVVASVMPVRRHRGGGVCIVDGRDEVQVADI